MCSSIKLNLKGDIEMDNLFSNNNIYNTKYFPTIIYLQNRIKYFLRYKKSKNTYLINLKNKNISQLNNKKEIENVYIKKASCENITRYNGHHEESKKYENKSLLKTSSGKKKLKMQNVIKNIMIIQQM